MKPLLVATRNPGKLREIESILGPGVPLKNLANYPEAHEVEEDGDTFEANALKKASEMCAGTVTLRTDDKEITLFKAIGQAVTDLVAASTAYSASE